MKHRSVIVLGILSVFLLFTASHSQSSRHPLAANESPQGIAEVDSMWQLQFDYNVTQLTGNPACIGVCWDGRFIWISGWGDYPDPSMIYIINAEGTELLMSFPSGANYEEGIQDMCTDGTYIYGGYIGGVIQYDPAPLPDNPATIVRIIPNPPGTGYPEAITYDPEGNNGQGSFYCGNYSWGMYEMDTNGNLIRYLSCPPFYPGGLAWDNDDLEGPWLWIYDLNYPSVSLNQYDPITMTITGVVFDLFQYFGTSTYPGGCEYIRGWDPNISTMMVLGHTGEDRILGVEMYFLPSTASPGVPSNFTVAHNNLELRATLSWINPDTTAGGDPLTQLSGIRIYRNSQAITEVTNVQIGQPSQCDDTTIPNPNSYHYRLKPYNAAGEGVGTDFTAWIGLDTPGPPGTVIAVRDTAGALTCSLSWTDPTEGAHGGYWPPGSWTGQKIFRNEVEVANLAGNNANYVDHPTEPDWYYYGIAYYNTSGIGTVVAADPESLFVGEIPYGSYDVGGGANDFPDLISVSEFVNGVGVGGPTIFNVYPGTYDGQVMLTDLHLNDSTNTLTFQGIDGPGGERPVVTNTTGQHANEGNGFQFRGGCYVTVRNFAIQGCDNAGISACFNYQTDERSQHITIEGNYFSNWEACDISVHYCNYATIVGNEICNANVGIHINHSIGSKVYNNMIYGCDNGLNEASTVGSEYHYNSFCINHPTFSAFLLSPTSDPNTIVKNNIFVNLGQGYAVKYRTIPITDFNCYYAPNGYVGYYDWQSYQTLEEFRVITGQDSNSISVDPCFLAFNDLHIADSSECVNSGTPITEITTDYDGDQRHPDSPCIGGDEVHWEFIDDNPPQSLPTEYALYPPYPNPFNTITVLTFSLPCADFASLVIYNIQGRIVKKLCEGHLRRGTHRVPFNASKLPTGLYFARFEAKNFQQVRKILLLK